MLHISFTNWGMQTINPFVTGEEVWKWTIIILHTAPKKTGHWNRQLAASFWILSLIEEGSQGLNYPVDASSIHARGQKSQDCQEPSCFEFRQSRNVGREAPHPVWQ